MGIVFEHPTQPGNYSGGWMAKERLLDKSSESSPTLKKSVSSTFINTTSSKTYTMSEVVRHNNADSAWIVVHDHVYDCTHYLKDHPGGIDSILINAGTDCTEEFEAIHSDKAKKMIEVYQIGKLVTTNYPSDSLLDNSMYDNSNNIHLAPVKEVTPLCSVALIKPGEKIPCKLLSKTSISHDVRIFRFALPSKDQILGLPIGKHIFLCATINEKLCMRAYTPTSTDDEAGYFDLVVKIYFKGVHQKFPNGGLMSQHLDSLPIGSILNVKGPLGHIEYIGKGNFLIHGKHKFAKRLALLAGGTGITPIYQVIQAILKDPEDHTEMHFIYANRTEDDILLREELDSWAKKHEQLKVWYVVRESVKEMWQYSVGFITESILREHIPKASQDTLAFACGPSPMIQFAVQPKLERLGYDIKNNLFVF
ncbi:Riboflavin synthase-like beta-barrel [Sesbania bispinosa]|nr:Riboflavin synthase-like beta-barrel [Sesbania bispinosa]